MLAFRALGAILLDVVIDGGLCSSGMKIIWFMSNCRRMVMHDRAGREEPMNFLNWAWASADRFSAENLIQKRHRTVRKHKDGVPEFCRESRIQNLPFFCVSLTVLEFLNNRM